MNIKNLDNYMVRIFLFSSNITTPPKNTLFAILYN